jgi:hypothetical protein
MNVFGVSGGTNPAHLRDRITAVSPIADRGPRDPEPWAGRGGASDEDLQKNLNLRHAPVWSAQVRLTCAHANERASESSGVPLTRSPGGDPRALRLGRVTPVSAILEVMLETRPSRPIQSRGEGRPLLESHPRTGSHRLVA